MSTEIILKNAICLYAQGKFDDAENIFRHILSSEPDTHQAFYFLGLIAMEKSAYDVALDYLYRATTICPKNDDYRYTLGVALQESGRIKEAASIYKKLPDMAEAHNNLANIYRQEGKTKQALAHFDKALSLNPTMVYALLNKALLIRQNDIQEALKFIQKTIKLKADFWEGFFQLGVTYRLLEKYKQSEEYLKKALELCSGFAPLWNAYGLTLVKLGKTDEAIACFDKAIAVNAFYDEAYFNKATSLEALGKIDEAEKSYRDAIRCNPSFIDALNNLGALLYSQSRLTEALDLYRNVIIIDNKNKNACFNIALILDDLNDYQQAAGLYLNVLSLDKKEKEVHLRLASMLPRWFEENATDAVQFCEIWLKLFPSNPFAKHAYNSLKGKIDEETLKAYSQNLYDAFADTYNQKMKELECRVPEYVKDHLPKQKNLSVLDLGCGTGTCGHFLKPLARRLIGVDISKSMIEKAKQRKLYTTLKQSDAIEFLEKSKIKFDLIVAADVLCYLTNLPKLFQAVAEKLSEKGQFIFTIEKTEKENYELSLNGRVFHNFDYVKNELSASGLDISIKEKINLRREKDDFAKGYIIIAERK